MEQSFDITPYIVGQVIDEGKCVDKLMIELQNPDFGKKKKISNNIGQIFLNKSFGSMHLKGKD